MTFMIHNYIVIKFDYQKTYIVNFQ